MRQNSIFELFSGGSGGSVSMETIIQPEFIQTLTDKIASDISSNSVTTQQLIQQISISNYTSSSIIFDGGDSSTNITDSQFILEGGDSVEEYSETIVLMRAMGINSHTSTKYSLLPNYILNTDGAIQAIGKLDKKLKTVEINAVSSGQLETALDSHETYGHPDIHANKYGSNWNNFQFNGKGASTSHLKGSIYEMMLKDNAKLCMVFSLQKTGFLYNTAKPVSFVGSLTNNNSDLYILLSNGQVIKATGDFFGNPSFVEIGTIGKSTNGFDYYLQITNGVYGETLWICSGSAQYSFAIDLRTNTVRDLSLISSPGTKCGLGFAIEEIYDGVNGYSSFNLYKLNFDSVSYDLVYSAAYPKWDNTTYYKGSMKKVFASTNSSDYNKATFFISNPQGADGEGIYYKINHDSIYQNQTSVQYGVDNSLKNSYNLIDNTNERINAELAAQGICTVHGIFFVSYDGGTNTVEPYAKNVYSYAYLKRGSISFQKNNSQPGFSRLYILTPNLLSYSEARGMEIYNIDNLIPTNNAYAVFGISSVRYKFSDYLFVMDEITGNIYTGELYE